MPRKKQDFDKLARIYLPDGWDPARYPGAIAENPDAAAMFLNCVYFHAKSRKSSGTVVPLKAEYLGKLMGDANTVAPIRKAMREAGLIVHTGYVKKVLAMGYRLGPALKGVRFYLNPVANARQARRYVKFRESVGVIRADSLPVHKHLASFAKRVQVDLEWAAAAIAEIDQYEPKAPTPRNPDPMPKGVAAREQLHEIRSGVLYHRPDAYGRFHSSWSTLSRELRPCLMVDGQYLAEIDLKTSQIYFLALDLILEETGERPIWYSRLGIQSDFLLRVIPSCHRTSLMRSLKQFLQDVCEGDLYKRFQVELGLATRDEAKKQVYRVLFGKPGLMKGTKAGKFFRRLYRPIFQRIIEIKEAGAPHIKKPEDKHAIMAMRLQRLESSVIVNVVCERFRVELPDVPLICVHDSLCVPPEYLDTAEQFIKEALAPFGQLPPKLERNLSEPPAGPPLYVGQELEDFLEPNNAPWPVYPAPVK